MALSQQEEAIKMFGLGKRKPTPAYYDPAEYKPVLHCSICTGEQVAGFKNKRTGRFEDVMLVRSQKDLQAFLDRYGLTAEALEKDY
jgi:hypothetical protein